MARELADLTSRLSTRLMRERHDWQTYCEAAKRLHDYERDEAMPTRDVLSAIVLIESTVEALEVEHLQSVERVALDYGRRLVRAAWRRFEAAQSD